MHRVLCAVLFVAALLASLGTTGRRATAINWNAGSGDWSVPGNWSPASLPVAGEAVNIAFADGTVRTVTLNTNTPALGFLSIDLTPLNADVTLAIPNNNSLTTAGISVGGYNGSAFTSGRGAIHQSNGTVTTSLDLILAYGDGSKGAYTLSAGVLAANQTEWVGYAGAGTFTHSDGANTINPSALGGLILGFEPAATGVYNLSGNGVLSSNHDEIIGYNGNGTFNQTGGSNTILGAGKDLVIGYRAAGIGTYNLSSGSLTASGIGLGMSPSGSVPAHGTFNQTGGTVTASSLELGNGVGSTGVYNQSGGVVTVGQIYVGGFAFGTYTLSGAGALSAQSLTLGVPTYGGGDFYQTGGTTNSVNALTITSGIYSLSGGILRLNHYSRTSEGTFIFNSGTIQLVGDRIIGSDAAILDLYGGSPIIRAEKGLTVEGTATISRPLAIEGGKFKANALVIGVGGELDFDRGVLELTGGSISGLASLAVPTNGEFRASGVQSLRIAGAAGSTITATGNLTLGNAAAVNGFGTHGTLQVGANSVTLLDANDVVFDSLALATLGSGASPGTLNASNGLTLDFGGNFTGFGAVSTPNNVAKPLINNGHITGSSASQGITLPGYVKGVGTFDNVTFTGTFSPGLSPTSLNVGNVALSPTSTLIMELGGTAPGSGHDQLQSSSVIAFDGTLLVSLINGFSPAAGQSFNLFDWASTSGAFDALQLPTLAGGLAWNASQLYTTGVLSVAPAFTADFDEDGDVDAADLAQWEGDFGLTGDSDADADGDSDGTDFLTWQRQLGSHAAVEATAAVPEPANLPLILFAATGAPFARRRRIARRVSKLIGN